MTKPTKRQVQQLEYDKLRIETRKLKLESTWIVVQIGGALWGITKLTPLLQELISKGIQQ
ncbi:hypothetical protein JK628_02825 [Shewanella sp. KX20019]|uniref:hypothetical protein n=1 Tax=Shewanella sp. KX20019 TaxID=2803864 RepID=UPI00192595A6|nr:hypothetical protein [Shewanella sp. KX20019]QQX80823.1 hypothetical protein JK628_02825 [Shewanella sp. KX20019]